LNRTQHAPQHGGIWRGKYARSRARTSSVAARLPPCARRTRGRQTRGSKGTLRHDTIHCLSNRQGTSEGHSRSLQTLACTSMCRSDKRRDRSNFEYTAKRSNLRHPIPERIRNGHSGTHHGRYNRWGTLPVYNRSRSNPHRTHNSIRCTCRSVRNHLGMRLRSNPSPPSPAGSNTFRCDSSRGRYISAGSFCASIRCRTTRPHKFTRGFRRYAHGPNYH